MKLAIPPLCQRDPRWKDKKLGTSTVSTLGNYGCTLTSLCMALRYFGKDTLPDKLNDDLVKIKGFSQGTLLAWGAVPQLYPDITLDWANDYIECPNVPAPLDKIDKLLDEKIPVIVKVDFSPDAGLQDHWVLIIGKENNSYLINDPWSGEQYYFEAKYGDPVTQIYKIVAYRGKVDNSFKLYQGGVLIKEYDLNPDDLISDLKASLQTANDQLANKSLELNALRGELEKQESDNVDLSDQLLASRQEKNDAVRQLKIETEKVESLQRSIEVLQGEKTRLLDDLAVLHASKFPRLTFWGWLVYWFVKGGENSG